MCPNLLFINSISEQNLLFANTIFDKYLLFIKSIYIFAKNLFMETLFEKHDILIRNTKTNFVRSIMDDIDWDAHLIALRGPRGVGKTTLMLQYIKLNYQPYSRDVLYCSLDTMYFASHSLLSLASDFYKQGGKHLFLDEAHKYENWSKEIKEIYDLYPEMRIVLSASSLLNLLMGDADLSRRCVSYEMQGLSFREYLGLYKDIRIMPASLETILGNPQDICAEVNGKCRPIEHFNEYLKFGYYPFYSKNKSTYYQIIEQVVNFTIDVELTQICKVDPSNIRKIKALLYILSTTVPFDVDISKLSVYTGINRNTIIAYLRNLADAHIIQQLYYDAKSVGKLQKPDKIYLDNTNLIYALATSKSNIGTIREAFAVNQLSARHTVEYNKNGDFRIDGKWVVEVGDIDKDFSQIADIPNSYILADNIETPIGKKLPLWLLGMMY